MSAHRLNPVDLLQTYTLAQLERIATSFHNGVGFKIPVDIDKMLETYEDVEVDLDYWPSLAANHKLLGMAGIDTDYPGKIFVFIDEGLADNTSQRNRYRMTVAEEFAHIILHRKAIETVKHPDDFKLIQEHPMWRTFDRNAKWLAAALLIPAENVLSDTRELYQQIMAVLPKETKFLRGDIVKNKITALLAERYCVSCQAMEYRLKDWPVNVINKIDEAMREQLDFLL